MLWLGSAEIRLSGVALIRKMPMGIKARGKGTVYELCTIRRLCFPERILVAAPLFLDSGAGAVAAGVGDADGDGGVADRLDSAFDLSDAGSDCAIGDRAAVLGQCEPRITRRSWWS